MRRRDGTYLRGPAGFSNLGGVYPLYWQEVEAFLPGGGRLQSASGIAYTRDGDSPGGADDELPYQGARP